MNRHPVTPMPRFLLTLFLAFSLVGLSVDAQAQSLGWGASTKAPVNRDFIPKLKSGEAYSERYTFNVPLEGGGSVYIDFTVSNLGWGDNNAATTARVEIPGLKTYTYTDESDEGDWSFQKSKLGLKMGKSSLEETPNGYRLRHTGKTEFELELTNTIPSWKPGKGRLSTEDGTFELALMAPRATASGRVKINGAWKNITSNAAMGDWSMSTVAPYDLAKRFSRFRAYDDDLMVTWREVRATEALGGRSVVWVLVTKGDQILFQSSRASLRASAEKNHKTSGYNVPTVFQIAAKSGDKTLNLTVRGRNMSSRDLLAEWGSVAKAVAGTLTSPYQFNFEASFELKIVEDEKVFEFQGKGPLGIDILNP